MNALATTKPYEEVTRLLVQLSVDEQLRLLSEISIRLQSKAQTRALAAEEQSARPITVKGKYSYLSTSSERFAQRKQEEIEQES